MAGRSTPTCSARPSGGWRSGRGWPGSAFTTSGTSMRASSSGANVHPKVVSDQLGHSSVAFTMDLYSHLMPSAGQSAAAGIEASLSFTSSTGGRLAADWPAGRRAGSCVRGFR
jgi:hypothetical protein